MWPGRSGGPALFNDAAWREDGGVGRNASVRYCNLHGFNLFDLEGLGFSAPNRTLTGGGICYDAPFAGGGLA
jgi:hypothetical protein